jgi:hypothetical protein
MDGETAITVTGLTKKGKHCIVIENYKFSEREELKVGSYYRCTNKKCRVSAVVDKESNEILYFMNLPHNHEKCSNQALKKEILRSRRKRRAAEENNSNESIITDVAESSDSDPIILMNQMLNAEKGKSIPASSKIFFQKRRKELLLKQDIHQGEQLNCSK